MIKTGVDGELRYQGKKVAKVRAWSLSINRETLDDSCLGESDRTYVPGMRNASGSATILYDPDDKGTTAILNSIFSNSSNSKEIDFLLNRSKLDGGLKCAGFVISVGASVSVGAATACEVSFQVSGPVEGRF